MADKKQDIWDFYGPDFPQELAGFGRLSPSSKLGLYTDPYHARAIDIGVDPAEFYSPTRGFMQNIRRPENLWDFIGRYFREGQPTEGILRENFTPPTEKLERGDYLVGLLGTAEDPYSLDTWHHEYGHVGQRIAADTPIDDEYIERSRLKSNIKEEIEPLQRARDLLYATDQKEFDHDIKFLMQEGFDPKSKRFRKLLTQAMMEDLGANKKLDEMGISRGAKPNLKLINNFMEKIEQKPIKQFDPPKFLEWLYSN